MGTKKGGVHCGQGLRVEGRGLSELFQGGRGGGVVIKMLYGLIVGLVIQLPSFVKRHGTNSTLKGINLTVNYTSINPPYLKVGLLRYK